MDTQEKQMEKQTQDFAMDKLRKELRMTRIFSAVSSLLMICILAGGFLVCSQAKSYVDQMWPLVEELSAVDFEAINDTVGVLNQAVGTVDWEELAGELEKLDVEAINAAIAELDTEELSKALININEAAETLKKLSEGLKTVTSRFGF